MMIMIMVLLSISNLNAEIADDKFAHAYVGAGIYVGCMMFKGAGEALDYDMSYLTEFTCLIPVAVAGIGKEIYDNNHEGHTAEWQDAVATMVIPLGASVVIYKW